MKNGQCDNDADLYCNYSYVPKIEVPWIK